MIFGRSHLIKSVYEFFSWEDINRDEVCCYTKHSKANLRGIDVIIRIYLVRHSGIEWECYSDYVLLMLSDTFQHSFSYWIRVKILKDHILICHWIEQNTCICRTEQMSL